MGVAASRGNLSGPFAFDGWRLRVGKIPA